MEKNEAEFYTNFITIGTMDNSNVLLLLFGFIDGFLHPILISFLTAAPLIKINAENNSEMKRKQSILQLLF